MQPDGWKFKTGIFQVLLGLDRPTQGYKILRPDGTPNWLMIYTFEGSGRVRIGDRELQTSPQEVVFWQPGAFQDYSTQTVWGQRWAHFTARPHWGPLLRFPSVLPGVFSCRIQDSARFERAFDSALEAQQSGGALAEYVMLHGIESLLIQAQSEAASRKLGAVDPRIDRLVQFVQSNLGQPISVEQMSDAVGLSVSRLGMLCQEHLKTSPREYVEQQKIQRAIALLELTPRPIKAIAEDLGFGTPFYFSLRFKHHVGQSPSEYRRSKRA